MRILGISAFYHDSAAALVEGGRLVAAAQEERFTRRKHDAGYPRRAIDCCLRQGGVGLADVDRVVFYDKPFLKFERLIETSVAFAPRGLRTFAAALPVWVGDKLFQKRLLRRELAAKAPGVDWNARLLFAEHHVSHAASAFYPSPFGEAAVLTLDGVGEWATTAAGAGRGGDLELTRELHFPHSLGLLYSAFTQYAGFRVNSGEYKLMGLAPYGEPKHARLILDRLIDLKADGTFRLDMDYFGYCTGLRMTNARFEALFGAPAREPGAAITRHHMDVAASAQAVVEEAVFRLTCALRDETGLPRLCLAGGVALNCVANGRVLRDGRFDEVWVQPAAGDAGGAVGAALAASHGLFGEPRPTGAAVTHGDAMQGALLGPGFTPAEIRRALDAGGARYTELSDTDLLAATVTALEEGKAVGWFQGRMEFGPRALGNRSILADARSPSMQRTLNLRVKRRESFRPFAPSVLRADAPDWFEIDRDSPYMLFVAPVRSGGRSRRPEIPAVTHVDGSARIQTVHRETNPRFHALLAAFKARTGCPVLVNTSFNVDGEPIVCTPADAWRCFLGTDIERLAIGNCFVRKEDQ